MSWYRTGTVAVTNGSKTVTGVGTLWTTAVNAGDAFALVDANLNPTGAWYEVEAVVSNTKITLKQSYAGTTGSNKQYCVFNLVGNMTTPSFAQRLATFFASFQSLIDKPTTTPTASSIPIADSGGKIADGWVPDTIARLASPALTGSPTAPTQTASDDSAKIATTAHVKDVVMPSNSLIYSGPRRIPSLTEPIGVVLVQTGGGAGVWDRVDLGGNPVACPPGYFSSRSEYSLNTLAIDSQCLVEIKKFHYANVLLTEGPYVGKRARFINKTAFSGSQVHPAFLNSSGVEIDQFYVAAYEGYDDGGSKIGSTNNKAPLVAIDFATMLSRCAARNTEGITGFQLIDIYQLAVIQYLALVEMGNPDAQVSLGRGNCDAPSGGSVMQTGTTTAIWRALHELWGNVWMMVQGIENRDGVLWVWCKDGTRAYVNTGFTLPSSGWVVDMSVAAGATFDLGALFIPGKTAAAADSGSWSDFSWVTKDGTTKICYHGSDRSVGQYDGLFALNLSNVATLVGSSIGGRLAKV